MIGAVIGFSYALSIKFVYFFQYPSQIDLSVTYLKSVEFPEVYICNPAPFRLVPLQFITSLNCYRLSSFRLTKVMEYGLYDVVKLAHEKELNANRDFPDYVGGMDVTMMIDSLQYD